MVANLPFWKGVICDRAMFLLFKSSDKRIYVQEMKHSSPAENDLLRWQLVAPAVGA